MPWRILAVYRKKLDRKKLLYFVLSKLALKLFFINFYFRFINFYLTFWSEIRNVLICIQIYFRFIKISKYLSLNYSIGKHSSMLHVVAKQNGITQVL